MIMDAFFSISFSFLQVVVVVLRNRGMAVQIDGYYNILRRSSKIAKYEKDVT